MLSLTEEKHTFGLSPDQVMQAHRLWLMKDERGEVIALSGWRVKGWVWRYFIIVHRDHQSRGLGKELTQLALSEQRPHRLLLLSVLRSNTRARKLYDRLGFLPVYRGSPDLYMVYDSTFSRLAKPFLWLVLRLSGR